ncbi:Hypothetical predicted protein [Paramuricea clavata]|uniref:Uncharacterized protein n=1 Tax=Paramuricea clavata TaxID=317549 RepID=A0A7D9I3C8_PARCT|nr:Hypothetical predicted protein [Paramuricea clavata]
MIISGVTDQEHLDNLEEVLSRLSEHGLRANIGPLQKLENYSQIDKEALALVWGVKKFHTYIFARHFTLRTDHKPLTAIFSPTKIIPATTAARVQRYALFLSGFDYEIEHRSSTQHCNADGLSRLPLATTEDEENQSVDPVEAFHVSQFSMLPVTWQQVRKATQRDSTLAQVYEHVMKGWHENKDPNLRAQPFYSRRNELTMHQGCIMWGSRVVIPTKLRSEVLQILHESHVCVVRMKALARSYVWWPGIDLEIERMQWLPAGSTCPQMLNITPMRVAIYPLVTYSCRFCKFRPFLAMIFLVIVHVHSKW